MAGETAINFAKIKYLHYIFSIEKMLTIHSTVIDHGLEIGHKNKSSIFHTFHTFRFLKQFKKRTSKSITDIFVIDVFHLYGYKRYSLLT